MISFQIALIIQITNNFTTKVVSTWDKEPLNTSNSQL